MLELQLDPRLPAPLRDAYLREARRAGIALADLELMSFDHALVGEFLAAVRENRGASFLMTLDRARLERAMRRAARDEARAASGAVNKAAGERAVLRRS